MPDPDTLDPGLRAFVDSVNAMGGPPVADVSPTEMRAQYQLMVALDGDPEEVASVADRELAGVPCRVYVPAGASGAAGVTEGEALPVLAWFHGGGWVIGDLDTADRTARRLANRSGCLVVSVDYRLAPEHPFPAAPDDCWAVTSWLAGGGAAELGGDPGRLAVGGDSAGGNLAAVVALRARDEGVALRHQLLVYPVTDARSEHPSYTENAEGYVLTADTMRWFTNHYVGPEQRGDWRVSPLAVDDVAGVAPAHVITAGFDPLRDEGDAYAERLRAAGALVEHRHFHAAIHGFFAFGLVTPLAGVAVEQAAGMLARAMMLDGA